jgi:hypothetical protein
MKQRTVSIAFRQIYVDKMCVKLLFGVYRCTWLGDGRGDVHFMLALSIYSTCDGLGGVHFMLALSIYSTRDGRGFAHFVLALSIYSTCDGRGDVYFLFL